MYGLVILSVKISMKQQYTSSEKKVPEWAWDVQGVNKSYLEDWLESDLSNRYTSECLCHKIAHQLTPNLRSEILSRLIKSGDL